MAETEIPKFKLHIIWSIAAAAEDQNVFRLHVLMPSKVRESRVNWVMNKIEPFLPNEDVRAVKAVGPFSSVNALQGFDNTKQSTPEIIDIFTAGGRVGGLEEVF